mmetsp:Transcript_21075/g.59243  ORF Transcript_21075/g.59243 Transcript_21075/m.59243 type:complete len:165 (-) Transcript_21075:177-671(-)
MGQQGLSAEAPADVEVELRSPGELGGRARLLRPFPWADLVLRAAQAHALRDPGSPCCEPSEDEVLRILERAEPRIRSLVESPEDFIACCRAPDDGVDRSAMVPTDWVAALLEQLPALRSTRFRLVPRRLTEDAFWSRFIGAVFGILTEELCAATHGEVEARSGD